MSKTVYSNKSFITIISTIIVTLIILLIFIQPGNYFKITIYSRISLLVVLIFFFIFSFSLQFYLNTKYSNFVKIANRINILKNIFFVLINSIFGLVLIYILHPNLHFNKYKKIFFISLGVSAILQMFFNFILKLYYLKTSDDKKIIYSFNDNSKTIKLDIEQLLFIKSSGNYIEIFEKNKTKGHILRSSLKDVESRYPDLIRCHKSYLVNPMQIKSISGNTKGYEISFYFHTDKIPVARDKGKKLREKFVDFK